ncbi:MAG: dicarboxylate/amino acid:cation symporter, partial [Lachnospiraceae bacterium]|nr:dicarboxylate/amino acid:cation symporter [Lachnospiraceae bacterium]
MEKKKIGLLPRLVIGIAAGILIGIFMPEGIVRLFATFNNIFGNFLSFVIPFIIIGFIVPGIADLGVGAGKLLALTAGIAYCSTIIAGSLAYGVDSVLFPRLLELTQDTFQMLTEEGLSAAP